MIEKIIFLLFILTACSSNDPVTPIVPVVEEEYKQYGTPFSEVPEPNDAVVYEINLRSFSESTNFESITNRLDEIMALGVNVIWLMPIYPVGELNSVGDLGSPYAVQNYLEVNSEFGNLQNLRDFVESAHKKGIAVILDWVGNHTAWDNPWINNSSWYVQDNSGNIISPLGTNWTDVAELNYNNNDMRKAMIRAMKYWILEANVDGFRCDAVDFVPKDFWKQAIDSLQNINGRKLFLLAEGGKAENFESGFQLNYGWDFNSTIKNVFSANESANTIISAHNAEINAASNAKKLRYITNHDLYAWEGSVTTFYKSPEGSLAAYVITAFLGETPLIYAGQEVAVSTTIPIFEHSTIDWSINSGIKEAYKKIMQFRSKSEAIKQGTLTAFNHDDVVAFKRSFETEEVVVIVNVRNKVVDYTIADEIKNRTVTNALTGIQVELGATLSLEPYEYLILKN